MLKRELVGLKDQFEDNWQWRGYMKVMKPVPTDPNVWEERATSKIGLKLTRDELEDKFPDSCGIYEMMIRKDGNSIPVYVGSTCVYKDGKIHARIQKYCHDGDHKAPQINAALKRGYAIWFRVKRSRSKQQAEADENRLLAMYDYAWNIRNQNKNTVRNPDGW